MDVPKAWQPSSAVKGAKERTIVTKHPVKTRVPGVGIPSHVKSTKRQTMTEEAITTASTALPLVRMVEENVVEGVPFSDRFFVNVEWRAQWLPPPHSSSTRKARGRYPRSFCRLEVYQSVVFTRRFVLENVVTRNSATETGDTLKTYEQMALLRFARADDGEWKGEERLAGAVEGKKIGAGMLSRLCKRLKRPASIGMFLTALCTPMVLIITCKIH